MSEEDPPPDARRRRIHQPERIDQLTPREQEVARLIVDGLTNREIASKLDVSIKTIDTHRHSVLARLGLRHNVDLVKRAIREGFYVLDDASGVPAALAS